MTSKEKIIISAESLILEKGYKNTSITDIIQKASVSKGSFFHFFPHKKALFLSIIDYYYQKDITSLFEKHFRSNQKPQKQILNYCKDVNQSYQKSEFKGGCLLGNMALELSDIDEVFRKKLDEIFEDWKQGLIKVLQKIETQKKPEDIADFIIWGLEGLTLTGKVHKTKNRNESEFRMFLDILSMQLNE